MLSDVCKPLAVVLCGPVGQTPPCGPDTLMEPFISCQPAAAYWFPAASLPLEWPGSWSRESEPDTVPLEPCCRLAPHGWLERHQLRMSDWTSGIPRALLLGQVPGKPFAAYHLWICYEWPGDDRLGGAEGGENPQVCTKVLWLFGKEDCSICVNAQNNVHFHSEK